MDDLIERLQAGCVYRPKRWSGDTHDDLGGPIDEAATESLLAEAAAALSQQRAVPEGFLAHVASVCRGAVEFCEAKPQRTPEDDREYNGGICLDELACIADQIDAMLATAPSPEQEESP